MSMEDRLQDLYEGWDKIAEDQTPDEDCERMNAEESERVFIESLTTIPDLREITPTDDDRRAAGY